MKNVNVDEILQRMRKIYAVESNRKLAECFGLKESSVSNWKSRGISSDILLKVATEKNVSLDWLVYGKEDQGRKLDPLEDLLLSSFNELDNKTKMSILSLIHTGGSAAGGINQAAGDNSVNNVFSGDNVTINGN